MNTVEFESDGRTYRVVQGLPGGNPYPTPRKGIFFLQKMSAGYDPAPHHYVRKVEELAAVREVLEVYADPGPFLRRKEHSEDPKLLFILGEVFSPCRMSSLEVPALAEMRPRYWSRGSLILPWDEPETVTLDFEVPDGPEAELNVTGGDPTGMQAKRLF